jgi:hypothetical protein
LNPVKERLARKSPKKSLGTQHCDIMKSHFCD